MRDPMRKRVLVLQRNLPHYRVPVFDQLAQEYEVTVVYSGISAASETSAFEAVRVPVRDLGPLHVQSGVLGMAPAFDAVVAMFDPRWLASTALCWTARRRRVLWWGHGFGRSRAARLPRVWIAKRSGGVLLYDEGPRADFVRYGLDPERIFVAPNTVDVPEPRAPESAQDRSSFLFVSRIRGERKRVDLLIDAFARIQDRVPPSVRVEIVGEGDGLPALQKLVAERGLGDRVVFHGEVRDPAELSALFHRALAYVSPGHVGLGVLHAFGHGVAAVTRRGPGHAPEIANLIDGETGLLLDETVDAFADALLELASRPERAHELGLNALRYYTGKRTVAHMVDGFRQGIEFVCREGGA